MAKLILSMDGLVLKEIALAKQRMSIGRRASNDIQIDNLAISGEHAAVVTILNDSFLEDLNSTNGTLVNGLPAKKQCLKDGDVIELGKYKLKYVAEPLLPAAVGGSPDFVSAPVARPAAATASSTARHSLGTEPLPIGLIHILNGANVGRRLELAKTLTTLGKPGVQVAVIARRPSGYFISHVEGARYPLVNGVSIEAQPHLLSDRDVVEIAGVKMEFFGRG